MRKMKISNIKIKNFRNLKDINLDLNQHAVIVGENGTGKSNLLYALRLVLDPTLSDNNRELNSEDFWEGLKPFGGAEIEIQIEFKEFENNPTLMAFLSDATVNIEEDKPTAILGYIYRPKTELQKKDVISKEGYEYRIYQGDNKDKWVDRLLRHYLQLVVLKALRDAEKDFRTKYRSPLKPFFDRIYDQIDLTKLVEIADTINKSSSSLEKLNEVASLQKIINERLKEMIGSNYNLAPNFSVSSTDSSQILNSLKLFLNDKKTYDLEKVSLGYANLIYLLLYRLNIEIKEKEGIIASTILGIEEPEAHLHPQVQRLIFKDIFKSNNTTLTTTHSPNIVSVAPLKSIILLKNKGTYAEGKSLFNIDLTEQEINDIQRYIDVTRGEIYFARGVIFVEGIGEVFLIRKIAELMSVNLDEYGVSICSVNGIDFIPYIKLVGDKGLDIPYVIITDGDKSKEINGYVRGEKLLEFLNKNSLGNLIDDGKFSEAYDILNANNIFVGEETLEIDLIKSDKLSEILDTIKKLNPNIQQTTLDKLKRIIDGEETSPENFNWYIDKINEFGKGRFCQSLASTLNIHKFPNYITEAIKRITELLKNG